MKWSNRTVLVTGGAGFIGRNLASKLLDENTEVVLLDNFSYAPPSNVPEGVELTVCDISDSVELNRKLANYDIDFIFHFAAPSSVILFNKDPVKCFSETTTGVLNLFKYAKESDVRKMVFPSSGSVYGKTTLPQSEDQTPVPVNLYGVTKLSSEYIASCFSEYVKYVGLRIFAGYGPGEEHKKDYASPVTLFLKLILKNTRPVVYGDGTQSRDFVYIDDIVKATMRACEVNYTGIINVGTGVSYTFNNLVRIINEHCDKNIEPIYIQKPTKYLERTCADIKRLLTILGVAPLDIETGLNLYLEKMNREKK